jgi:hypothetical protein
LRSETSVLKCCFDKRVWAGLGVLAVALLLADPRLGWAALPVLAGIACPVSMLFMMRGMGQGSADAQPAPEDPPADAGRAAGIARLRHQIEQLKEHTRR